MSQDPYQPPIAPSEVLDAVPTSNESRSVWRFLIGGFSLGCLGLLLFGFLVIPMTRRGAYPAAMRMQCSNNMKQISLALLNYEADYGSFPPAVVRGPEGEPLHSWRTLILPYLEQTELYESIDLSKPWDDPANEVAFNTMPSIYACPIGSRESNVTTYQGLVAPEAFFLQNGSRLSSSVSDGHSETLMFIEAPGDETVHWMEPADFDAERLLQITARSRMNHGSIIVCAFADGSIQALPLDVSKQDMAALTTVAGGEQLSAEFSNR